MNGWIIVGGILGIAVVLVAFVVWAYLDLTRALDEWWTTEEGEDHGGSSTV